MNPIDPKKHASLLTNEIKKNALALSSLQMASDTFNHLCNLDLDHDPIIRSSLLHAGIIHYVRPFKGSNFRGKKVMYSENLIKGAKNYKKEIHTHLIEIRDQLIAHSDDTMLPPEVVCRWFAIGNSAPMPELNQIENPTPIGIAVMFGILKTLDNKETLTSIYEHVSGISDKVFEILSDKMKELFILYHNNSSLFKVETKSVGKETYKVALNQSITLPQIGNTVYSQLKVLSTILFKEDYSFLKFVTEISIQAKNQLSCSTQILHEYPNRNHDDKNTVHS